MYGRVEDLIYYTSPKGMTSVSLDDGETMILPTGKTMKVNDIWEESPVDLREKLKQVQTKVATVEEVIQSRLVPVRYHARHGTDEWPRESITPTPP